MGCQRIPQTTTDLEPISSPSSARSARTDSRDGSCRASARSCLRHMRARWDRSTSTMPPSASAANTLEPAGFRSAHPLRPTSRGRSHREPAGFPQPLHLAAQLAVLFLKFEDARNSSQVDALLLAELLRLREAGDVAQRIASRATFRTLRYDQAKAIVLAQRLRMHVGELAGRTDREDGQLDVETDFGGTVQVGPAGHDRHGAHFIQPLDLPCGARLGGLGSPR